MEITRERMVGLLRKMYEIGELDREMLESLVDKKQLMVNFYLTREEFDDIIG